MGLQLILLHILLMFPSAWSTGENDQTYKKQKTYGYSLSTELYNSFCLTLSFPFGEGNGNPLQYSWLENPRDGGAWWAALGSHRVGHDWRDLVAAAAVLSF